jgi:hypothetical protein
MSNNLYRVDGDALWPMDKTSGANQSMSARLTYEE